jgi:hypothetical protein
MVEFHPAPCHGGPIMNTKLILPLLAALLGCGLNARAGESFDAEVLSRVIRPAQEELKWMGIPWETDLTIARQKASAGGKPIFLWEMDGHPLGCV